MRVLYILVLQRKYDPEIDESVKSSKDFKYGYSPERINPGDNELKLTNIVKLTRVIVKLAQSG